MAENDTDLIDIADDITISDADASHKKVAKKQMSKKTQKDDVAMDNQETEPEIPVVVPVKKAEPPPPVIPISLKKTRNRKKINTKTIKKIQRFF